MFILFRNNQPKNKPEKDFENVRFMLIGYISSGKSSIISRYVYNKFEMQ